MLGNGLLDCGVVAGKASRDGRLRARARNRRHKKRYCCTVEVQVALIIVTDIAVSVARCWWPGMLVAMPGAGAGSPGRVIGFSAGVPVGLSGGAMLPRAMPWSTEPTRRT